MSTTATAPKFRQPMIDNHNGEEGFLYYTVWSSSRLGGLENPVDFTNVRHARRYATDKFDEGYSVTVIYVYQD